MGESEAKAEEVLNGFAELMTRLLLDQYQEQLAELELTLAQAQVLRLLWQGAAASGQLAAALKISAPAVTQLTERLVSKGLVERRAAAADKRSVLVALSPKGRRMVEQFRRRRRETFAHALAGLTEEERARAVATLEKIIGALEAHTARQAVGNKGQAGTLAKGKTSKKEQKGEE